jgi:hypothetical protein
MRKLLAIGLLLAAIFGATAALSFWHTVPQVAVQPPPSGTTTFDPTKKAAAITLTNGNLTATSGSGATAGTNVSTVAGHSTGKFYAEFTLVTRTGAAENSIVGIVNDNFGFGTNYIGSANQSIGYTDAGTVYFNGGVVATYSAYAQGDVICIAVDLDAKKVWFRVNGGNWNNSGTDNPATNTGGLAFGLGFDLDYPVYASVEGEVNTDAWTANFGATAYAQTPPSGFVNW